MPCVIASNHLGLRRFRGFRLLGIDYRLESDIAGYLLHRLSLHDIPHVIRLLFPRRGRR